MIIKNPTDVDVRITIDGDSHVVEADSEVEKTADIAIRWREVHQFLILEDKVKKEKEVKEVKVDKEKENKESK